LKCAHTNTRSALDDTKQALMRLSAVEDLLALVPNGRDMSCRSEASIEHSTATSVIAPSFQQNSFELTIVFSRLHQVETILKTQQPTLDTLSSEQKDAESKRNSWLWT